MKPAGAQLRSSRSRELHEHALKFLPGGVTGDGRYEAPYPTTFAKGGGKWLYDVDGNRYLDFHGGFGSAILGYSHPEVDAAVRRCLEDVGIFIGVPHPAEAILAERLCDLIPFAETAALCGGGGSDAIYHAVRLARAATGRSKLLKIEGGYHGWHDDLGVSIRPPLTKALSPYPLAAIPHSAGSLPATTGEVLVVGLNDGESLMRVFAERGDEIAAMVIEPVLYSAGCVLVEPAYLELARSLSTRAGALLIFDEVMTGFRCGLSGAGARLGVLADLAAFGKALANGYIISALVGRAELMRRLTPAGDVFYSGTFNGHPLSVAAALATLDVLARDHVPERIERLGERVATGINGAIRELGVRAVCQSFGSVWNLYFNTTSVRSYQDLARSVSPVIGQLNDEFRRFLREQGIYVHKRHVNRCFVSAMHDEGDIDETVAAVREFLTAHRKDLGA